jgi:hypothetical protein
MGVRLPSHVREPSEKRVAHNSEYIALKGFQSRALLCNLVRVKRRLVDLVHLFMAATLLAACERVIVDPALPSDAVMFNPPPEYTRWWAMTEQCSGRSGSLASITWDFVPHTTDLQLNGETVTSYWTQASNSIVLADAVRLDGSVVRHEMLHALTRASGHPRGDFLDRCGGVVSCSTKCVADGGDVPKIDAAIPVVPVDSLNVALSLVPSAPSLAIDSGSFTMIISVRNSASHSVVAALPPLTAGNSPAYSYALKALFAKPITGSRNIVDPSVIVFAAGETKYQYFDFFVGKITSGTTISPAIYDFVGSYGTKAAVLPSITIFSN